MNNNRIKEEAEYYINNPVNAKETAEHFNISVRTFQLHMSKLEEICAETFSLYNSKRNENIKIGQQHGGYFGKRKSTYSKEEISDIAKYMLAHNLTYDDVSEKVGIPKSTLQELITKEIDPKSELKQDFDSMMQLHIIDKKGVKEPTELMDKYKR